MDVRRKRRLASEINVVPYIDVMLVLVVIFMATATIAVGVQVDLPESDAQQMDNQKEPVVLTINRDGKFFLNIGPNPEKPITAVEVAKYAEIAIRHDPTRSVVVSGDQHTDYGQIMNGMVLLQNAGAKTVGMASKPR